MVEPELRIPPGLGIPALQVSITPSLARQESDPLFSLLSARTPVNVTTVRSTELHAAVVAGKVSEVAALILRWRAREGPEGMKAFLDQKNEQGYTALMNAASIDDEPLSCAMIDILLLHGADVNATDLERFTALHWAAACGGAPRICQLIEGGADIHAISDNSDTPLHRAARFGRSDAIKALVGKGADARAQNSEFMTPIDAAGHYLDAFNPEYRLAACIALTAAAPSLKTLFLHHPDCMKHEGRAGHQEAPERIEVIVKRVQDERVGFFPHELNISTAVPFATDDQILRAHSAKFLQLVKALDHHVRKHNYAVPFTPHIQRGLKGHSIEEAKPAEHSDTPFSSGSLPAALRAAGAVCAAVDAVAKGEAKNAFCCVRPPGHHAGVNGLLEDFPSSQSCGFCIFNSVAIGAFHALEAHPDKITRVAIIDFDVHHGNGTEEIVRRWANEHRKDKTKSLFFFSIHLHDVEREKKDAASNDNNGQPADGAQDGEPVIKTRLRTRRSAKFDDEVAPDTEDHPADITMQTEATDTMLPDTSTVVSPPEKVSKSASKSNGRNKRAPKSQETPVLDSQVEAAQSAKSGDSTASGWKAEKLGETQFFPWISSLESPCPDSFRISGALVSRVGASSQAFCKLGKGLPRRRTPEPLPLKTSTRKRKRPAKYAEDMEDPDMIGPRSKRQSMASSVGSDHRDTPEADTWQEQGDDYGNGDDFNSEEEDQDFTLHHPDAHKRGASEVTMALPEPGDTDPHPAAEQGPTLQHPVAVSPASAPQHASPQAARVENTPPRKAFSDAAVHRARTVSFTPVQPQHEATESEEPPGAKATKRDDEDVDPALHVMNAGISLTPRMRSASFGLQQNTGMKRLPSAPAMSPSGLARIASFNFAGPLPSPPIELGEANPMQNRTMEPILMQRRSSFDIVPGAGVFVRASPPAPENHYDIASTSGISHPNKLGFSFPASSPGWKVARSDTFIDQHLHGPVSARVMIVDAASNMVEGQESASPAARAKSPSIADSGSNAALSSPRPSIDVNVVPHGSPPPFKLGMPAPSPQILPGIPISGDVKTASGGAGQVAFAASMHGPAYAMLLSKGSTTATETPPEDDIVFSFYPGTGMNDSLEHNCWNAPIPPLWRERKETRNRNRDPRKAQMGRLAVRKVVTERLLPSLRAFCPDVILISAGFDGGHGDVGNSKNDGKATPGMNLSSEDFSWITSEILSVARVCCPGRVVSVLEGGYGQWKWRKVAAPAAAMVTQADTGGKMEAAGPPEFFPLEADAALNTSNSIESNDKNLVPVPYLQRDNLAENCVAHIRALVDDGGAPTMEGNNGMLEEGGK